MSGNTTFEEWSLDAELKNLGEIIQAMVKGDLTKRAKVRCVEFRDLANKINILAESVQKHINELEDYADKLEAGAARKHLSIEELEGYADKLEAGAVRKHAFIDEMEEYANRLETGVAERMKELAEIGEAVAGLSHCIKNVVNNLKAGSYVIEQGLKKDKTDKVKQGWSMLGRNIGKISDLAMDMLFYSKRRTPEYQLVKINSLISEIESLVKEKANSLNVKIQKELDPEIGEICLDPKGIYRCLLNLVSNSLDACEERGDGIVCIKSYLAGEGDYLKIEVSDNGCGIEEESLKRLFTTFFSTKGSKGTGLGLPVTYKIIREHGGSISVQSQVDQGTTFSIQLPAKRTLAGG